MKKLTRYRTIEFLELLAGSVLPIIFWVSLIFGFDAPYIALLTLISALIHEAGHITAIWIYTRSTPVLRGHSSGFRISLSESLPYSKEVFVLLSGPLVNIAAFLILIAFGNALNGYTRIFAYVSLATGISNLLPVEGYDGYRAMYTYFLAHDLFLLLRILEAVSFTVSITLTFISLHLIDLLSEGYWIFGLFFITSMSKILNFGKCNVFEE